MVVPLRAAWWYRWTAHSAQRECGGAVCIAYILLLHIMNGSGEN